MGQLASVAMDLLDLLWRLGADLRPREVLTHVLCPTLVAKLVEIAPMSRVMGDKTGCGQGGLSSNFQLGGTTLHLHRFLLTVYCQQS